MSSPYVVLGNRSLDQWKVTELKEELKRRKLITRGLKEDLIKRLDEAVRNEWESAKENADSGLINASQPELPSEQAMESKVSGRAKDLTEVGISFIDNVDGYLKNDCSESLSKGKVVEEEPVQGTNITGLEGEQNAHFAAIETTFVVSETVQSVKDLSGSHLHSDGLNDVGDSIAGLDNDGLKPLQGDLTAGLDNNSSKPPEEDAKIEFFDPNAQLHQISESSMSTVPSNEPSLQGSGTQSQAMGPTLQLETDDSECPQPDHNVQPLKYQVSAVDPDFGFQVISDSASTESVSIIEKNDLKIDAITDDVKLELEVNHEMVQPSLSSLVPDAGESHPMDVEEPLDQKISTGNAENADNHNKIDSGDLDPPKKLSLDRSFGDDSMEEDVLESKQVEYKPNTNEISEKMEKSEVPNVIEEYHVDVVVDDKAVDTTVANGENEAALAPSSVKRKFHDKEAVGNIDTVKRHRKWNIEGLKVSEPQSGNVVDSSTPKDLSRPSFKRFSRSDTTVNEEAPKERLVPPSSKAPSSSLRIDRFLRPFTLKAVQELLGRTGTVTSFWMDHIKTHCYVSYSSVEEAVETRNAVYNLQWPPNGGLCLIAEFVDPQEVKTRVEPPPSSSAAPTFFTAQPLPIVQPQQPSPRQQVQRPQVPPPSSLPPPPPSIPSPIRERPHPAREQPLPAMDWLNLPPPPPLPEKVDPPILTLDDLFKKTKATPRIYYLPLSDELVAAKLKAQGKNVNQ